MLLTLKFDSKHFFKLKELADEHRYDKGLEFLAKRVDEIEETLRVIAPMLVKNKK